MYKIVLAVGLTGGHIYPARTLAENLGNREFQFLFVAREASPLAKTLLENQDYSVLAVKTEGMPRSLASWLARGLPFLWSQWRSFRLVWTALSDWRPHLAVGFGSYVSFPVIMAAKLLGVKTMLFEPNAQLGLANRILGILADKTVSVFLEPGKKQRNQRSIQVAPPLRKSLLRAQSMPREQARHALGLDPRPPCVVIVGGSQGSLAVNQAAGEAVSRLCGEGFDFRFLHISGSQGFKKVREFYLSHNLLPAKGCVREYLEEMGLAYRAATVLVGRSGAMTTLELAYFGAYSILVPLSRSTEGHQAANARYLERLGIARIIEENNDLSSRLYLALKDCLRTEGKLVGGQFPAAFSGHSLEEIVQGFL